MKKQFSKSRRSFFKKLTLLGGAVALTGFADRRFGMGKNGPKAIASAGKGYRMTPHIKTYYRTAED
ncbi:MAG: formate dehydrogenase [Deltaproteobacteria bacterium]|nr:formate dehydrogenase [Deltaproteobacteria bacterium]